MHKKAVAGIQLSLMIISVFSFAFIISEGELVSGKATKEERVAQAAKTLAFINEGAKIKETIDRMIADGAEASDLEVLKQQKKLKDVTAKAEASDAKHRGMISPAGGGVDAGAVDAAIRDDTIESQIKKEIKSKPDATTSKALAASEEKLTEDLRKADIIEAKLKKAVEDKASDKKIEALLKERDDHKDTMKDDLLAHREADQEANPTVGTSPLSKLFGVKQGGLLDPLMSGIFWAGIVFGAGQVIGSFLGFSGDNTLALSSALSAGVGVYSFLDTATTTQGGILEGTIFGGKTGLLGTATPLAIGVVVAAAVFILMYKDYDTEVMKFDCMTWQAPKKNYDCEVCNDEDLPCSEYRCRSLGQNCEIVNSGTVEEKCVNVNPNDVIPPIIKPNTKKLSPGHTYTDVKQSPPGPGFKIIKTGAKDGCLKAFTPLEFGVDVNEPSQCKIDFNHTESFEDMVSYMGGSNLFLYNHTEVFALPGAKAFEESNFELENGKDLTFYIRCMDKSGNVNEAEYAVTFCMDPTPDTTPPKIKATSVNDKGCIAEDTDSTTVEFYTDEPAQCRWSHVDQIYDDMPNDMSCSMRLYQFNAEQLFTCAAKLEGIARDGTDFYVRCKDQPGMTDENRNKNAESYTFSLRGSSELTLSNIKPNETIFGGVNPMPVELYAETLFGCDNGQAICFYSTTGEDEDYIAFFDTDKEDGIHTQRLDVYEGTQEYYVKCVDSGGNVAESKTTFTVDIDTSAPVIARVYEENDMLKVVTVRNSECSYSFNNCDFTFDEGTAMPYANSPIHVAEWNNEKTYFIKCRDEFLNEEADCSAIVRPSQNFF